MSQRIVSSVERRLGFRLLFTKNPLPMWVYGLESFRFLEVNEAAVAGYGYTREEFLRMRVPEIDVDALSTDDPGAPVEPRPGLEYSVIRQHRRKNGDVTDVHVISHMLRFAGRPAVLVVAQDITERRRADAAVRQSEERYRRLVDEASDVIYTIDLAGRFTSVNRRAAELTGYTQEEALATDITRVVDPNSLPLLRDIMARKLAGEERGPYEIRIVAKDGRRIPVELNGHVIYRDGRPIGFQGIARDLSERKRAEDDLRARTALMHRALLIGEALARPLTVAEVIPVLGEGTLQLTGATRAAVFLRHPDDTVTCPWMRGVSDDYGARIAAGGRDLQDIAMKIGGVATRLAHSEHSVEGGGHFHCSDIERLPPGSLARHLGRAEGYRAVGVWSLVYGRRDTALIVNCFEMPRAWSMAERDVFETCCRQGAAALENARLYDMVVR